MDLYKKVPRDYCLSRDGGLTCGAKEEQHKPFREDSWYTHTFVGGAMQYVPATRADIAAAFNSPSLEEAKRITDALRSRSERIADALKDVVDEPVYATEGKIVGLDSGKVYWNGRLE